MQEPNLPAPQKLTMNDRKSLTVTGVREVGSFDENLVALTTSLGTLVITGSGLKLRNLSLEAGQAAVEGHIDSLNYEEPRTAGGFWHRLFG